MGNGGVRVIGGPRDQGLKGYVTALKGPLFRDVNQALRFEARDIADAIVPAVADAVRASAAPQADAMSRTIRTHNDRVPVVVVGKTNPRFKNHKFARRGSDSRRRRGAMALGVIAGPLGGRRDTKAHENYYKIPRDPTWGPLGAMIRGPIMRQVEIEYLRAYLRILKAHGFDTGRTI